MSGRIYRRKKGIRKMAAVSALLLFFLAGLSGCQTEGRDAENVENTEEIREEKLKVFMVHNNPCESCREPEKLMELLSDCAPEEGPGSEYEGWVYYAYQGDGQRLVEQAAERFGLEQGKIVYPLVIVGDQYLMGYSQMEENLTGYMRDAAENGRYDALKDMETEAGKETADASAEGIVVADAGPDVLHLLYFHTEICPKCEKAEEFLSGLPDRIEVDGKEYPLVITKLSVAQEDNAGLFGSLADEYGVPAGQQQVPFVFLGETYLSGEKQICRETKALLEQGEGLGYVYRTGEKNGKKAEDYAGENTALFLLRTVGVGFLNGFNPCALSLVLLFLSLIAALPKGYWRYGFTFLLGKLIAYTLLGFAAAMALSAIPFEAFAWMRVVLNVFLLALCLVLALGNLLDCYHAMRGEYGKIRVQLPGKLRRKNDALVKKIVDPKAGKVLGAVIFLGSMAIACGEFFCTGQIYLASILQWIQRDTGGVPIIAFLLYSAALCLPSLCIFLLIGRGKSVFTLTSRTLKNMPLIKLCNAVLFLIFAVMTWLSL